MGLKITPLDNAFSLLIRERADYTCERCHREYPNRDFPGGSPGLHASHYWGRANQSTRFCGMNVFAHCYGCHSYLGGRPHEFKSWIFEVIGELNYDELTLRANEVCKRTKVEKKEMTMHFKAQRDYIKKRRANGDTGYIDFSEWD